jgi:hypothetical protein
MSREEFGRCTFREFFHYWNRHLEDVNLRDTQFAQLNATIININIDTRKTDPVSAEKFKMIRIKKRQPTEAEKANDWKLLMQDMKAFSQSRKNEIIRKKVE